jgi:hypothetical protein
MTRSAVIPRDMHCNERTKHMPTIDDYFPSKFLNAASLDGEDLNVTIESVSEDTFEDKDSGENRLKPILHFREKNVKPMICNKTNFKRIAAVAGQDTANWPGTKLILYPDTVPVGGKEIDTIKVRIPSKPKAAKAAKAADEPFSDEIDSIVG